MTDDEKPGRCDATTRAGDQCRRSPGHTGLHRLENGVTWAPGTCGTPHPDKPVTCSLTMAHPGAHLDPDGRGRWTAMWGGSSEPESDAPSWPPKEWTVPQTIRGEVVQVPVSGPCGVRLYLPTGKTPCVLQSGHEGLHGTGQGAPLGGRLVEEALAEAYQRISRLESMLDRERGTHDRYRTQTQQTYERQIRLQSTFQDHVADRLRQLDQRLDNAAFRLSGLETRVQSVDLGSASAVQDIERRMETITNHLGKHVPGPLTEALVPASEVAESLRLMTRALNGLMDRLPAKACRARYGLAGGGELICTLKAAHDGDHHDEEVDQYWILGTTGRTDQCGVTDGSDPDKDAYVCSLTPGHEGDHCDEPNGYAWPWRRRGSGLALDLD